MPGAIYTCPMHPEVRQDHPGDCPLCGMALEPLLPVAGPVDDTELKDMTRRLWVSAPLAAAVVAIAMGRMLPGVGGWFAGVAPARVWVWLELILATPAVLWAGSFFFVRAWRSLRTGHLNMFTLIAMGTAVALSHDMFDAALLLGICDKIVPGLVIGALAFGHLPLLTVDADTLHRSSDRIVDGVRELCEKLDGVRLRARP